jgi:hypothetical protein
MVQSNGTARAATEAPADVEALEFVRFCHRRKHVGWPELYDEMCAVAGRGLYRGYRADELASIGIGLGLFEMPTLAGLVSRVVAEEQERRRRQEAVRAVVVAAAPRDTATDLPQPTEPAMAEAVPVMSPSGDDTSPQTAELAATDRVAPNHGSIRIAVAAGA